MSPLMGGNSRSASDGGSSLRVMVAAALAPKSAVYELKSWCSDRRTTRLGVTTGVPTQAVGAAAGWPAAS